MGQVFWYILYHKRKVSDCQYFVEIVRKEEEKRIAIKIENKDNLLMIKK